MGRASYDFKQQEYRHMEEDQRCKGLAQEEGEGRNERKGKRAVDNVSKLLCWSNESDSNSIRVLTLMLQFWDWYKKLLLVELFNWKSASQRRV